MITTDVLSPDLVRLRFTEAILKLQARVILLIVDDIHIIQ